jgi:hypothetical protein
MKILQTEIRHRVFDDMWMLMGQVPDYDNIYRYRNEDQKMTSLIPTIWIILDVHFDRNKLRLKKRKTL